MFGKLLHTMVRIRVSNRVQVSGRVRVRGTVRFRVSVMIYNISNKCPM